jgi:hypothetical protein
MRVYRIHINSENKIYGTWANGFYPINVVPHEQDKDYDWFLSVETFVINQTPSSAYLVSLPDVSMNSTSYSTLERDVKNIVLLNNQPFYFASLNSDSTGNHISYMGQFQGKLMRVLISNADTGEPYSFTPINGTVKWSMILVLHGIKKD